MASQQAGQEVAFNANEFSGQNKRNKDEFLNQVSDALMQEAVDNLANAQADEPPNYTSQATNFLQQQTGEQMKNMVQGAGEQVKSMAQGASEAMKSTLGMKDPNPTTTAHHTGNTAGRNPSSPANSAAATTATTTTQH